MSLRYTALQLLQLKQSYFLVKDTFDYCRFTGILRPTRYIHHSTGRRFFHSSACGISIPAFRHTSVSPSRTGADLKNLLSLLHLDRTPLPPASPRLARSALLNTCSVNSKALLLCDIIKEKQLDLLCLTETWHKQNDGLLFNQLVPPGYGLFDLPRISGRGGGIIVIYNLFYSLSPITIPPPSSFECLVLNVSIPQSTIIATVYRPPKPSGVFLGEFADFLSFLSLKFKRILILGDFNIHIDSTSSSLAKDFLSLLGCFDLTQFVCTPTHNTSLFLTQHP
ncbi:uncharacterized protein [Lepisosteus oculatus]|uniref:uncharacterized protein n=1 Tax=Lepisosteus oculatus TaxID=7918 RepID=UPI0035F512A1